MIGVAAGRFHTVLWTREAVYTMGLNGGQLGTSQHRNVSKASVMRENGTAAFQILNVAGQLW